MFVAPTHIQIKPAQAVFYGVFARTILALCFVLAVTLPTVARSTEASSPSTETASPIKRIEKNLREIGGKAVDGAADISSTALSLIGVNYKFGGNTPEQGLDCSGFVRYVFQQATGINLPRSTRDQAKVGQSVAKDQLQPGDLVFFNTRRFQFSHVGLYLGNNRFVHSPSSGGAVEVVELDNSYWKKVFNGARRIIGGETTQNTQSAQSTQVVSAKKRISSKNNTAVAVNTSAASDAGIAIPAAAIVDINSLPMAKTYPMGYAGTTDAASTTFQLNAADK
jgi:cell wall-associated NlpC family hydrolase